MKTKKISGKKMKEKQTKNKIKRSQKKWPGGGHETQEVQHQDKPSTAQRASGEEHDFRKTRPAQK